MKKGFTLIELLVVILIIGILTGVALPQYRRSVRRAEMLEGLTHGKTLWDSAIRYKAVNGKSPNDFKLLDAGIFGSSSFSGNEFQDGNFTYSLADSHYLQVISNKGGYSLRLYYPVSRSQKITAGIFCCPNEADDLGTWLCKNIGKSNDTGEGATGCYLME